MTGCHESYHMTCMSCLDICPVQWLMAEQPEKEEQYLLRILDKPLAERVRGILRQPITDPVPQQPEVELRFSSELYTLLQDTKTPVAIL